MIRFLRISLRSFVCLKFDFGYPFTLFLLQTLIF